MSRGFTLVELLVVIAIIGILVALLLPAIQAARESARRSQCMNNLKQIGLAVQMYHDTAHTFPMGRDRRDQFGVSWAFRILPQMEERAVYDSYVKTARVDDDVNARAMRTPIETYACPSRRRAAADRNFDDNDAAPAEDKRGIATLGDYGANAGLEEDTGMEGNDFVATGIDLAVAGPIYSGSRISARRVIDGLSSTLAVGERHVPPLQDDWEEAKQDFEQGDTCFLAADTIHTILCGSEDGLANGPDDPRPNPNRPDHRFGGPHPGVVLFVYLDGHADTISRDIELETLKALSTIGGEEVVKRQ